MKRAYLITAAVGLLVFCFALANARIATPANKMTKEQPAAHQVKIDNFSFNPVALTVPVGSAVTWTNQDDVPHTVVSTDGKGIKSSVLDTDDKFTYVFKKPGAYAYYCSVHPRMTGTVTVK